MCFTEAHLQYQQLFKSGVAPDKIILKTLAHILIWVVNPCIKAQVNSL